MYPFPDSNISKMLNDVFETNLIELLKVKRPEEVNQVDNLNYCKYHHLISDSIEKCFVLKDKIMRLHESRDIVFDDEITTFNTIIMVNLGPHYSLFTINFSSFELIKLGVILPMSFIVSSSQTSCIIRISMVRKLIYESIYWKIRWKSILVRNEVFSTQSLRKPITLNEYLPIEIRRMENVLVACYHVDKEKTLIEPVIKESHVDSSNLSYGVCTTEISFNDEDLLLGSKLHNWPILIKGYVDKKMVNCILMDDGLAKHHRKDKTCDTHGRYRIQFTFPCHRCQNYLQHATWKTMNTLKWYCLFNAPPIF